MLVLIADCRSRHRLQAAPLTVVQPSFGLRIGTDKLPVLNNRLNTPQPGRTGQPIKQPADYSGLQFTA